MNEDPALGVGEQAGGCLLHNGEQFLQAPERKVQLKCCKVFQVHLPNMSPQVPQTERILKVQMLPDLEQGLFL